MDRRFIFPISLILLIYSSVEGNWILPFGYRIDGGMGFLL